MNSPTEQLEVLQGNDGHSKLSCPQCGCRLRAQVYVDQSEPRETIERRLLAQLNAAPELMHHRKALGEQLGVLQATLDTLLGKLVYKGHVLRPEKGYYQAVPA